MDRCPLSGGCGDAVVIGSRPLAGGLDGRLGIPPGAKHSCGADMKAVGGRTGRLSKDTGTFGSARAWI